MTNLQGITSIECENHRKLDPYTYDRSDKCKQEQEQEHTHTHTHTHLKKENRFLGLYNIIYAKTPHIALADC